MSEYLTWSELNGLPDGSIVKDDSDEEWGAIKVTQHGKLIQWDNGCVSIISASGIGKMKISLVKSSLAQEPTG